MTNDFRMSYFMPPIAPIKNEQGRIVTPATLVPSCEVSVEQVLASKQQMFRSFFTSGGGRYRPSRLLSGGSGNAQHIV